MQNVNVLKFLIISLFLLSFIPTGHAQQLGYACKNSTSLNVTDIYSNSTIQHCAYGCYMGECLDGGDLAFNGLLMLSIYWIVGFAVLLIGNNINSDEYGIIKTVTYAMGTFFIIAGIFGFLNVYEKSAGIGDLIKNISVVFVQGIPYALATLLLIALLYKIFNYMQEAFDKGGSP